MKSKKSIISICLIGVIACLIAATILYSQSKAASSGFSSNADCVDFDSAILTKIKQLTATEKEMLLSGLKDGSMKIYGADLKEVLSFGTPHKNEVHAIGVSPNRDIFVSGDKSGMVLVWDLTSQQLKELKGAHKDDIKDIAFSPDGAVFATASKDRTIKVWDAKSLNGLYVLKGHKSYVTSVDFSPKENLLASAGVDNQLILWDLKTGEKVKEKSNSHYRAVNQVTFSPDGKSLYTGSSDTIIKAWSLEKLESTSAMKGHVNEILGLSASPDGKTVLSAGRDKALFYFDAQTGEKIATVDLQNNIYTSDIRFSKDGSCIYIGDMSGDIICVDYKDKKLLNQKKAEPVYALSVF